MIKTGVTGGAIAYADSIAGTGLNNTAINKTCVGMLVLNATNTFVGGIDITAGTLAVSGTNNLGNANNGVVISDGATFAVTATATFASGHAFSVAGNSTFDIAPGTIS